MISLKRISISCLIGAIIFAQVATVALCYGLKIPSPEAAQYCCWGFFLSDIAAITFLNTEDLK